MARTAKTGLSYHEEKGFRISIGKKPDGGYRTFWLGHDRMVAEYAAEMYRRNWAGIELRGGTHWTAEDEAAVKRGVDQFRLTVREALPKMWDADAKAVEAKQEAFAATFNAPAVPAPAPSAPEPKATTMLHAALDAYAKAVQKMPGSQSYRSGIADSMEALKAYREDCPLADVNFAWLESATNYIKARPLSRKKTKATGQCEPIKPYTVARLLQHARQAFKWIHRHRESGLFGHWRMPEDAIELFSVDLTRIMTKAERDKAADGPDHITVDEIVALYKAADCDLHRILILMGVFTAQGQTELATTRRDEFDLTGAGFAHRRNKTGQRGVYWLPPELVKLLTAYFAKHEAGADNLAFLTSKGSPLVTEQSDAVRQAMDDWRVRANISRPGISFYSLRRFFADRAARVGGDSLRDTALAHSAKSVGGKHYSNFRDFDTLTKVAKALHKELKAKGIFDPKAKPEPEQEK